MDVTTDDDGATHGLHIALFDQNIDDISAQLLQVSFCKWFALTNLCDGKEDGHKSTSSDVRITDASARSFEILTHVSRNAFCLLN